MEFNESGRLPSHVLFPLFYICHWVNLESVIDALLTRNKICATNFFYKVNFIKMHYQFSSLFRSFFNLLHKIVQIEAAKNFTELSGLIWSSFPHHSLTVFPPFNSHGKLNKRAAGATTCRCFISVFIIQRHSFIILQTESFLWYIKMVGYIW